ncbi:HU family DNA-binding protein [Ascidiimonas sp. W6]|uniref:HU family DNA-binding protein n=1 Tax=Ascidiimonas meishanensis TaxID=3128903 RepID=UPI0030ED40EE
MSVTFRTIQKRNPQDLTATPKYYALAIPKGTSDIDRLSELIADGSTVRQADVYEVIIGLVNAIQGELKQGRNVVLGKLGTFSLGVNSEGVEEEEKVTANQIKKARIRYRPGTKIRNMLKTLRYQKERIEKLTDADTSPEIELTDVGN